MLEEKITKYFLDKLGPFFACYDNNGMWIETLTNRDVYMPMDGVIVRHGEYHYQTIGGQNVRSKINQ